MEMEPEVSTGTSIKSRRLSTGHDLTIRITMTGYQKLHENITSGKTDHQEGLDFYHDSPYSSMTPPSSPGTSPLLFSGTNLWPINPPPLKPTYLDWVHRMKQLGLMVMKAMADGLGMSSNEWEELKALVDDTFWVMRLIGYPKLPKTNEGISCGAHKGE